MIETLKTLCKLSGAPGFESQVREYIRSQAEPHADLIREDPSGNLLVFKKGREHLKQTVMLCAHMDEVAFMVKSATADGFLKFDFIGIIDNRVVLGKPVYLGESRIPGVIGCKPIHLTSAEERKSALKVKSLYIDIGAKDKEEAERLCPPGTWGVFDNDVQMMPNHFLKAKAIDDRVGCAILLALLRQELPVDTWFAFTVQEEIGCRGAFGAAFGLQPNIAIVLEGTTAADNPICTGGKRVCECGHGPAISFVDNKQIADYELFDMIRNTADKHGIPWQYKTRDSAYNDTCAINTTGRGCRTCMVAVPLRYAHSASALTCLWDVANTRLLIEKVLCELEEQNV